jgi:hypothetical protein
MFCIFPRGRWVEIAAAIRKTMRELERHGIIHTSQFLRYFWRPAPEIWVLHRFLPIFVRTLATFPIEDKYSGWFSGKLCSSIRRFRDSRTACSLNAFPGAEPYYNCVPDWPLIQGYADDCPLTYSSMYLQMLLGARKFPIVLLHLEQGFWLLEDCRWLKGIIMIWP